MQTSLIPPPAAFVYILTNRHHTVLYVGMTTNFRARIWEHQQKINPSSFTARYNVLKPVYFEGLASEEDAIERELFVKGKTRQWKIQLIETVNPEWLDLTDTIMAMPV